MLLDIIIEQEWNEAVHLLMIYVINIYHKINIAWNEKELLKAIKIIIKLGIKRYMESHFKKSNKIIKIMNKRLLFCFFLSIFSSTVPFSWFEHPLISYVREFLLKKIREQ